LIYLLEPVAFQGGEAVQSPPKNKNDY